MSGMVTAVHGKWRAEAWVVGMRGEFELIDEETRENEHTMKKEKVVIRLRPQGFQSTVSAPA